MDALGATNPAWIDPRLDSRAVTFENPTGARGAGGAAHGGRKGAPSRRIRAGERVVLADLDGPGTIRHLWMTFPPAPPEQMRAMVLEVFYDGAAEPSVSVPCLDFFGLPHGRPVAYHSALTAVHEGRGFNSYLPMPFRRSRAHRARQRVRPRPRRSTTRSTTRSSPIWTPTLGYLHVAFRRENPTVQRRDFVIAEGLRGPGRFLGCVVGVRVIDEGDVVRRGRGEGVPRRRRRAAHDLRHRPRGLRRQRLGHGARTPRRTAARRSSLGPRHRFRPARPATPTSSASTAGTCPTRSCSRPSCGSPSSRSAPRCSSPGRRRRWTRTSAPTRRPAPAGCATSAPGLLAWGIVERVDDYCATSFVYCADPQPVPRVDLDAALADIDRRDYEVASPFELLAGPVRSWDTA